MEESVRIYLLAPGVALGSAMLAAMPCQAQGNINAGRSPAQMFADTCAACHHDARGLRRSSVAFLQKHYTSGYQQAAIMAEYLSRLPSEPRPAQPKPVATTPADASEQQGRQQPATADQPISVQAESNSRPPATPEARPLSPAIEDNGPFALSVTKPPAAVSVQPSTKSAPASRPLIPSKNRSQGFSSVTSAATKWMHLWPRSCGALSNVDTTPTA
jgi:hypothetical protein